ncbi:hypothetical protein GDO81_001884 [Engystomops pustulosus]|uniref:G-protein coupled receptors family 1 profile domain-containing protein n=1 Tax=Engystomops pustulosus TaxID=76066 RepID=A0AAV7DI49_ENGPU|nr:hypothetical protein GDO81_001884 [Engystomops pustulosus]
MDSGNHTHFILAGFTLSPVLKTLVCTALIIIYILSVIGNLLTIITTSVDQHLQAPMYFFLRSLATLDVFFISTTVPKLLSVLVGTDKAINLSGCLLQLHLYLSGGGTVFYNLGVLSIDRYLAICHPLQYNTIMTSELCWKIVPCIWILGFLEFIPAILLMSRLHWGSSNIIDHFFCDTSALLRLSCSDTYVIETIVFYVACFPILSTLVLTIFSYFFIISSILRIASSSGRKKTFSTCSSHFIAVIITYGCCIFIYIRPAGTMTLGVEKPVAVFNSIITPFLHPFIYSLRNQQVVTSLRRIIKLHN